MILTNIKAYIYFLVLVILGSLLSCGPQQEEIVLIDDFRYSFPWDTAGIVQKIEKIELADVFEMKRLAASLRLIDNDEAQLIGKYFEAKADYYRFDSFDWMSSFNEIYDDLKEHKLYSYLYFIDHELYFYYNRAEKNRLAEERLSRITDYVYLPEAKGLKKYLVSLVSGSLGESPNNGDMGKLLAERQKILKTLVKEEWSYFHFLEHLRLARIYEINQDSTYRAYEIYDELIEDASGAGHSFTVADCNFQIALSKAGEGLNDESIQYLNKAIDIVERSGHNRFLYVYYYYLGHMYMEQEKPDLAVEEYLKAYNIYTKVEDDLARECLAYIAWATFKIGESEESYAKASFYFEKALDDKYKDATHYFAALQRKQWALQVLNRKEEAEAVTKQVLDWHPLESRRDNSLAVMLRSAALEVINRDTEFSNDLAFENESQKKYLVLQRSIIVLSSLLLLFGCAIIYYYKKKNSLFKETIEKDSTIKSQYQQLIVANKGLQDSNGKLSVALEKVKDRELQLEGELKNQILMSNNMKSMLRVLEVELGNSDNSVKEKKRMLKIIQRSTNNKLFEDIDHKFLKTNESFFAKLSFTHPNLTKNDLMLSALLKMNLSSKEIAEIQYKEVGSVKVARSRLSKKLQANNPEIENVITYLNSITLEEEGN